MGETCQRVKSSRSSHAPLRPLPIASGSWRSVSLDFVFNLPADPRSRTDFLVFVDQFSKMVLLAPVSVYVTAENYAVLFLDIVFRHHGLLESIVSDCDPRFVAAFWHSLFLVTQGPVTDVHRCAPQTDGQTERVNRVLEDVFQSYATSFSSWSNFLLMAEIALNKPRPAYSPSSSTALGARSVSRGTSRGTIIHSW